MSIVSISDFLNSEIKDYRYEKSGSPNEFRLFHCKPNGTNRFALYFGAYSKTDDEPFTLTVTLSNVDIETNPITIFAEFKKAIVHHFPMDSDRFISKVSYKICQVLNHHQVAHSVAP